MNTKLAFEPAAEGAREPMESGELSDWSGGSKLLESCAVLRSSLSHLLVGNANTEAIAAELSAALRSTRKDTPVGVVGAQVGNLLEYVEMYCLASMRGAFRVRASGGQQGTLWFDAGQLVHAQVESTIGEDAALKILSWHTGTLAPASTPFPTQPSIESTWQSLVLQAEAWDE
jgi:hypothetical protein